MKHPRHPSLPGILLPICLALALAACSTDEEKLLGMWDIKEAHFSCDKPGEFVDDSASTLSAAEQMRQLEQMNLENGRQIDFLEDHRYVIRDRLLGVATGWYKWTGDSLIFNLTDGTRLNAARFQMLSATEFQLWQSYPYGDPANKCVIRQVYKKQEE